MVTLPKKYFTFGMGTVKAHVHNILKKADHASRQDLTRDFWKE